LWRERRVTKESFDSGRRTVGVMDELEALYRAKLPDFRRAAAAIAGDREAGHDAVQEAFATAVRKRRSWRRRGPLEAWVWRIVVNKARDARRRRPPELRMAPTVNLPDVSLDGLTRRQREIVFLHYYADLDYAEIGDALRISPGTVGATLNAARSSLRAELEEVGT
jgi:DNA-directed RNA polymerase specialized sigma24 family protein